MGCAFCVLVLWCIVVCVVCVGLCVLGCVCGCGVWCVWCVWCGLARKNPVFRFKTSSCVGSKRFRVCWQHARMCSTCARFAGTRKRFEPTHGDVLNLHTERREGEGFSSLSLVPSLFLSSFFFLSFPSFSSFVLFLFSFSSLSITLSITMTMIARPVGSLCVTRPYLA